MNDYIWKNQRYYKNVISLLNIFFFAKISLNIFEFNEAFALIFLYICIIIIDFKLYFFSPFFLLQSVSWLKYVILGSEHTLFLNADECSIDLINYSVVQVDKFEFTLLSLFFWFFVVISISVLKKCFKVEISFKFSKSSSLLTSKYLLLGICMIIIFCFDFQQYFTQISMSSRQEVLGKWASIVRILSILPIFSLLGKSYRFNLTDFLLYLFCIITIYFVSLSRFFLIFSILSYTIIAWSKIKFGMKIFVISIAILGISYVSVLGNFRQELIYSQASTNVEYLNLFENVIKNNLEIEENEKSILGISAYGQYLINTQNLFYGYGYVPVLLAPLPSLLLPFKKPSSLGEELLEKNGFSTGLPLSAYVEARLNFGYFFFFGAFVAAFFYFLVSNLFFEFKFINLYLISLIIEPNVISLVSFVQSILLITIVSKIYVHFRY